MILLQNAGVPIYQQIAEQLKEDILSGKLQEGEYLPSIRGLAKELKILSLIHICRCRRRG